MATLLVVALFLELNTFKSAYSATTLYDDIQYQLPSVMPYINNEWDVDTQSDEEPESQTAETAAITATSCQSSIYDNFDSPYFLGQGQTSPNGEWKNVYSGYGSTGVKNVDWRSVFYLNPKACH